MSFDLFVTIARDLIRKIDANKNYALAIASQDKKKAKHYLKEKVKEIEEGKDYSLIKNYVKHCNKMVALFDVTVKSFKKINIMLDELRALADSL